MNPPERTASRDRCGRCSSCIGRIRHARVAMRVWIPLVSASRILTLSDNGAGPMAATRLTPRECSSMGPGLTVRERCGGAARSEDSVRQGGNRKAADLHVGPWTGVLRCSHCSRHSKGGGGAGLPLVGANFRCNSRARRFKCELPVRRTIDVRNEESPFTTYIPARHGHNNCLAFARRHDSRRLRRPPRRLR